MDVGDDVSVNDVSVTKVNDEIITEDDLDEIMAEEEKINSVMDEPKVLVHIVCTLCFMFCFSFCFSLTFSSLLFFLSFFFNSFNFE